jgi:hypothetical protein
MGSVTVEMSIDRSRAAISSSRASITRSRDLITDSRRLIARPRIFVMPTILGFTEEQHVAITDRWETAQEQRLIEREIGSTVRGDFGLPVASGKSAG